MIPAGRMTIVVAIIAVAMPGCGGGGEEDRPPRAEALLSPATVASADANCRYLLRAAKRIGSRALADPSTFSSLEMTTQHLVKPSIPLLERVADRQQALEHGAGNPGFELYANLFDPIVAVARERLSAGRAGEASRSKHLEELLTNLGLEQRKAARDAGLPACDIDFQRALLSAINE